MYIYTCVCGFACAALPLLTRFNMERIGTMAVDALICHKHGCRFIIDNCRFSSVSLYCSLTFMCVMRPDAWVCILSIPHIRGLFISLHPIPCFSFLNACLLVCVSLPNTNGRLHWIIVACMCLPGAIKDHCSLGNNGGSLYSGC